MQTELEQTILSEASDFEIVVKRRVDIAVASMFSSEGLVQQGAINSVITTISCYSCGGRAYLSSIVHVINN